MDKKPTLIAENGVITGLDSAEYYKALEADVLARTLWGEARGEGEDGMQAVANVICNRAAIARAKGGYWWGNDIIRCARSRINFPAGTAATRISPSCRTWMRAICISPPLCVLRGGR